MTQFSTELLNFLAPKQDIDKFFRTSLKTAMNDPLQAELSALLGYEPYDKVGYNSGTRRNGSYSRKFETKYGTVQLSIPRDRNGNQSIKNNGKSGEYGQFFNFLSVSLPYLA